MAATTPRALILSDIDCTKYPQPVYLARAIAARGWECRLLDPLGLHRFTAETTPEIRRRAIRFGAGTVAALWSRFMIDCARFRPDAIIALNETNLAPLRWAADLSTGRVRIGAYFLDYWEDPLAVPTRRLKMGHRALEGGAPWLDFVIECQEERLKLRRWVAPARHRTFILHNTPPKWAVPRIERERTEGPMRVVYAGRNDPNACVETLLGGLAQFAGAEADLYLTGHARRTNRLKKFATELGLGTRARFHEPVAKEELWGVLARADAGAALYPYDARTNLNDVLCAPNKVFEYLAAGLALLVSGNATLRFAEESRLGVCVDPRDAESVAAGLAGLAEGRAHEAMGLRARAHYENVLSHEREAAPIIEYLNSPLER